MTNSLAQPDVERSYAERFSASLKQTTLGIVEASRVVAEVNERYGYKALTAWLDEMFGVSRQTGDNLLRVFRNLVSTPNFSVDDIATVAPSALYLLANPNTPDEARDIFVEKAKAGEAVSHAQVKDWLDANDPLLAKHRTKQEEAADEESAASPDDAEITPGLVIDIKENAERRAELKAARVERVNGIPDTTEDLRSLLGNKFGVIYADPPWKYGNQATRASTDNHYPTMDLDAIAALPVQELAADDAHLHLWVTNGFLFESKAILDAWGFEFRSTFIWCKPQMGIGNYWRNSHEILLTAIRGDAKRFNDRSLMSWGTFDRGEHSAKPGKVREYIERASPGPRLELFGRRMVPGWTVWGNQIERGMFDTEVA